MRVTPGEATALLHGRHLPDSTAVTAQDRVLTQLDADITVGKIRRGADGRMVLDLNDSDDEEEDMSNARRALKQQAESRVLRERGKEEDSPLAAGSGGKENASIFRPQPRVGGTPSKGENEKGVQKKNGSGENEKTARKLQIPLKSNKQSAVAKRAEAETDDKYDHYQDLSEQVSKYVVGSCGPGQHYTGPGQHYTGVTHKVSLLTPRCGPGQHYNRSNT